MKTIIDIMVMREIAANETDVLYDMLVEYDEYLRKIGPANLEIMEYMHKVKGALDLINNKRFVEYVEHLEDETNRVM